MRVNVIADGFIGVEIIEMRYKWLVTETRLQHEHGANPNKICKNIIVLIQAQSLLKYRTKSYII